MFPWGFLGEDSRFCFRFVPRFDSPNGITFPLETVLPGTRKECSNPEILTKWQAARSVLAVLAVCSALETAAAKVAEAERPLETL